MDYEKAYKMALEKAKNLENTTAEENALIDYLFPELKDGEDERIRKGLLETFNKAQFGEWGKLKIKDIIAYLEKHKEQKPAEWSEDEKKVLDSIIDDYEKAAKSFCGYDGKIMLLKAIRDGEYDLPKQEWSEEDENKIESIKGLITTGKFIDTNTIRTIWKVT